MSKSFKESKEERRRLRKARRQLMKQTKQLVAENNRIVFAQPTASTTVASTLATVPSTLATVPSTVPYSFPTLYKTLTTKKVFRIMFYFLFSIPFCHTPFLPNLNIICFEFPVNQLATFISTKSLTNCRQNKSQFQGDSIPFILDCLKLLLDS